MEKDLNRLLEKIVLEAKGLCNADGGTLYLSSLDNTLRFTIMHTTSLKIAMGGTTGIPIPIPPLRMYDATGAPNYANVTTSVALTHQSVNIPDIYNAEDYDFSATREFDQRNGYRSISSLAVPLMNNEGEIVGVLQLLNAIDPDTGQVIPFDSYHQLLVEMLATQAAVAVNNQILVERQKELLKLERDVQIGRQIQQGFLPESLPQPENWEIAAYFDPAREVSGDFYDAFPIGNDRIGIVIADVCDKGVGAALFMSLVRSLIRAYGQQRHTVDWVELIGNDKTSSPDAVGGESSDEPRVLHSSKTIAAKKAIELTNKYILDNHSGLNMFATMFLGVLDPQTGTLFYVNCGHNPPVIAGPNGIRARLAPEFPAVGMMPDLQVHVRETMLQPNETLFTFTDGVIEAKNPAGGMFTDARLMALIEQSESGGASATGILKRVQEQLQAHIGGAAQFDDITMLAVWRRPQI
jgi:sigma-B regulation protein RsbU (phosphoserine phosphatase)